MQHKNDYSVVVFFKEDKPKRWTYVHNLESFSWFLKDKHSNWDYMNVYERKTRNYLTRFYNGNVIPKFLPLFFLTFSILDLYFTFNGFNNTVTIPIL